MTNRSEKADDTRVPVRLTVEWAVRGKQPGSLNDYSVLACSGGRYQAADYNEILSFFSTGVPADSRRVEFPSTWITFNWQGILEERILGLSINCLSGSIDAFGRPIVLTSYFTFSYRALAESRLSYTDLYQSVEALQLPPADSKPIELIVRRLTEQQTLPAIERFDSDVVARTASLLLNGPVNIIDAEQVDLHGRIQFIEAVASLLPYGLRASLAATTWAEATSLHRIRLAFVDQPRDDYQETDNLGIVQLKAGWTSAVTGYAGEYLWWLRELQESQSRTEILRHLLES
jgi:hypothetical protein